MKDKELSPLELMELTIYRAETERSLESLPRLKRLAASSVILWEDMFYIYLN